MSFLRSRKLKGSKPISKAANSAVVSSNGRVVNPFQDTTNNHSNSHSSSNTSSSNKPPPPSSSQVISVTLNNADLPNARKMIVLQEYHPPSSPGETKGLHVRRGETVSVLSQQQDWCLVRNERGKEGYVPCAHLVAPYSTMRSRQKFSGGPIRPVASGSSIEVMDHASIHGVVPMYPSRSAGRPRNYSMGEENRIYNSMSNVHQRVYSPQEVVASSNHYGSANHRGNVGYHHGNAAGPPPPPSSTHTTPAHPGTSSYDQKYSPSTSSGVASLTGTGSPVMRSDGSQHSSFCSIEERGTEGENNEGTAPVNQHNGISSMRARATSETNIAYSKHTKPATFPPQMTREPRPLSSEQPQPESDMVVNNDEDTPPPLPPRSYYSNINSHVNPQQQNVAPPEASGDQFVPPPEEFSNSQEDSDPYAAPMDAIPRSPHLGGNQPHLHNGVELRSDIHTGDDHGVYSEVYHGYQRPQQPYRLQNGYHLSPNGTEEGMYSIPPSDGSSSNSQVSRHSHVSSSRTQGTERPFPYSRDTMSEATPNGDQNEIMGMEYPQRPSSMTQFGSGQIKTFRKNLWGLYTVVDNFNACDENELSVREGDHVSVWNQDDPEWYWIVKHDTNEEGFVPSCCLKEIVSDNRGLAANQELPHSYQVKPDSMNGAASSSALPPPLPPKQPQLYPKPPAPKPPRPPPISAEGSSFEGPLPPATSHQQRFRDRSSSHVTSHDHRPSSIPPPGNVVAGGYRRRLNSDGSGGQNGLTRNQSSSASIEKRELSISPPNSPPPPYSKYDQGQSHQLHHQNHIPPPPLPSHAPPPNPQPLPPRHKSMSQHDRPAPHPHASGYSAPMQRTYSQGQVPYRRVHIPHSSSGSGGRLPEEEAREDGVISPPDVFAETGGTLV